MTVKATLSDVNKSLLEVAQNTEKTSKGIDAFLEDLAATRRRELEAEREAMVAASSQPSRSSGTSSSGGGFGSGFKMPKMPSLGLGKLLTIGGLTTAAVSLGKGLITRGIPGIALTAFADEIADYLVKGEGQEKLRGQFAAGLKGAGIGFTLFGKKGFILGGIFEFLRKDPKVDEELGKLVDNLEVLGKAIFGEFSFSSIAKKITEKAGSGLESLNKLISGESFSEGNINSIAKDMQGAAAVLGVFGFLVSSRFRKALLSISGLKKLAVFTGLLKLAEVFGYTMIPSEDKDKMPRSERPDMMDYGVAGGTLAYGAYKTAKVIKNRGGGVRGDPRKIDMDYTAKVQAANKLSSSALAKAGLENKGGGVQQKGGKFATNKQLDAALTNKYPRLFSSKGLLAFAGSAAKGSLIGAAVSAYFMREDVQRILNSDLPEEEKKKQVGAIIGANLNAAVMSTLGGLVGLKFGPVGGVFGALAGGIASLATPDLVGSYLADFFMGRGSISESEYNLMTNPTEVKKRINSIRTGTRFGDFDASGIGLQRVGKSNIDASTIGANINPAYSYPMFDGPGGVIVDNSNSGNITNNQTTAALLGNAVQNGHDVGDQLKNIPQFSY